MSWNKQLSRTQDNDFPSYFGKEIASRMAVSMANFKSLELNCWEMKKQAKRKLKRKGQGKENDKTVYQEIYC